MMASIDELIEEIKSEKGAFWLPDSLKLPSEYKNRTKRMTLTFFQGFHDGAQAHDNSVYTSNLSEERLKDYRLGNDLGKEWRAENE